MKGKITRLQPFGAFVEIAPGVEGLVHISELGAGRRINHPKEVVSEGQEVEASVLSIDHDKRRLSLSLGASKDDASAEDVAAVAARTAEARHVRRLAQAQEVESRPCESSLPSR